MLTVPAMGVKLVDIGFGILGRTAIKVDGRLQENLSTPRVLALLGTLIAHAGHAVTIDMMMEWVWPEEQPLPQDRVSTLHTYATRIRRVLQRSSHPSWLQTGNGAFRLDVDKGLVDYHQFRGLITQARSHLRESRMSRAVELSERALELWRGRPLDDLTSDAAHAWRTRVMRDEWLPANVVLLEAVLALGDPDQVLARLNSLHAEQVDDLPLVKLRMSALHQLNRASEATACYFAARKMMLEDGDEHAADHLRQHHESLRTRVVDLRPSWRGESAVAAPRRLPRDIVNFVGRRDQLRALDTAMGAIDKENGGGVVILDGMPGAGKSALAVHWAHTVRDRFKDGDFFVNLNGFSDAAAMSESAVVDDLLLALGQELDSSTCGRSRELLLSRLMADRKMLIVLDNVRGTDQVENLVSLLSGSLILVTSRQRLTSLSLVTGAHRVQVPKMPDGEAVELLSARLGAGAAITPQVRDELVGLCGGLPLVITVLAEHVASSGTAQTSAYVRQLDRRQVIAEFGEDGDGSTMAHTFFHWSYRALASPERRLFRLLGLHPCPEFAVGVGAACAGWSVEETKRSFSKLMGAHLIEQPDMSRYRFHDLLHEFAAYCAELDEQPSRRQEAERRMISHYLDAATQAHRIVYPGHMTPPELPLEDGVESVQFADVATAQAWFGDEGANVTAVVRRAQKGGHNAHAWRLADTVATFLDRHGRFEDSRSIREVAVAAAGATGDREAEASSRAGLGMVLATLGEHVLAQRCLEASLRYAEKTGNERGQAATLYQLGRIELTRGASARAVELFARCLAFAQQSDDSEAMCWSHVSMGEALQSVGDHDRALVHLRQGEFLAQRIGEKSAHASSLLGLGTIYRERGDHQAALSYCKQALSVTEELPDIAVTAEICITLAEVTAELGDFTTAEGYAEHAQSLSARSGGALDEARAQATIGNVRWRAGDATSAVDAWRRAVILLRRLGNAVEAETVQRRIDDAGTSHTWSGE